MGSPAVGCAMPDGRAQRTHAIFMRALDVETSERAAFVVDACDGDQKMRERVERLIAALGESGDYLEVPALGARAGMPIPDARRVRLRGARYVEDRAIKVKLEGAGFRGFRSRCGLIG